MKYWPSIRPSTARFLRSLNSDKAHIPNAQNWRKTVISVLGIGLGVSLYLGTAPRSSFAAESAPQPLLEFNQLGSSPNTSFESGRSAYLAGRFTAAIEFWQAGLQESSTSPLQRCALLNNLSLAYQELGQWTTAQQMLKDCQVTLDRLPEQGNPQHKRVLVQNLTNQSGLHLKQGDADLALPILQQVESLLSDLSPEQVPTLQSLWLQNQINQIQALQAQGFTRLAEAQIAKISAYFEVMEPSLLKATGLRILGNTLVLIGNLDKAQETLEASLAVAETIAAPTEIAQTLMSLADLANRQLRFPVALRLYERLLSQTIPPDLQLEAQVNRFRVLLRFHAVTPQPLEDIEAIEAEIETLLSQFPPSRPRLEAQMNLAKSLLDYPIGKIRKGKIASLLAQALQEATAIADQRSQSNILGTLGNLYEKEQRWADAQRLTAEALSLALSLNANDLAYQWQWQQARVLSAQGQTELAKQSYDQSISTLSKLQRELVALNPEARFSFREGVEPLYREFVGFLLRDKSAKDKVPQENLKRAQEVMDSLQLAELVNFFRSNCITTEQVEISEIDDRSAVIYPIVLENSLEILVSIPNQETLHYSVDVPDSQLQFAANLLRRDLISSQNILGWQRQRDRIQQVAQNDTPSSSSTSTVRGRESLPNNVITLVPRLQEFDQRPDPRPDTQNDVNLTGPIRLARRLYDWVIRPIEADLVKANVDTLVFVPDGPLRNIPISVFYDVQADQFLLEKYAIAITPGLHLFGTERLADRPIEAFLGGLSESVQGFAALPSVKAEIENIAKEVQSSVLLDAGFREDSIAKALQREPYPVVHLATHGQFSSDADQTFILTWDDQIKVDELSELLRSQELATGQAIELLILSACETAAGDDRAALGLAGVAVRAGARSTMATLWVVDDAGTSLLMSQLYGLLSQRNASKAEVLRQAQLTLLNSEEFRHPFYWAPFILVGNWL